MREYIAWLEKETGYKVDPVSAQLSSMLRPAFQKIRDVPILDDALLGDLRQHIENHPHADDPDAGL